MTEDWPTEATPTSFYARHKAEVERRLDRFERDHPNVRVVRMRPALSFKREAAEEVRRLFVGPLVPAWLLRPALIPVVPSMPGLRFQAVQPLPVEDLRPHVGSCRSAAGNRRSHRREDVAAVKSRRNL